MNTVITNGIPNLLTVEPGIYRGGQPSAEGWAYLKSMGVIRDIKLNTEFEASDDLATTNEIQITPFPVDFEQQFFGIRGTALSDAAGEINNSGTFVHCEHGQDRTGVAVAIYRVRVDGWTKEAAQAEMLALGFHKILLGLWRYWEEFTP